MANQELIDYENAVKQENIAKIAALNNTKTTIDGLIAQSYVDIDNYNTQKDNADLQIADFESQNDLIDDIIVILSS